MPVCLTYMTENASQTQYDTYFSSLEEAATLLLTGAGAVLLEEAEGTLASLVALAGQELQGLLAGEHLATADDAAVLVLDEVLLLETTGGVLGSTVENLGLGTDSDHLGHLIHWATIFPVLFSLMNASGRAGTKVEIGWLTMCSQQQRR
jgi:hypothetical protein